MCLICVEFDKGKLKKKEARRALSEMVDKIGEVHAAEVKKKLDASKDDDDD